MAGFFCYIFLILSEASGNTGYGLGIDLIFERVDLGLERFCRLAGNKFDAFLEDYIAAVDLGADKWTVTPESFSPASTTARWTLAPYMPGPP